MRWSSNAEALVLLGPAALGGACSPGSRAAGAEAPAVWRDADPAEWREVARALEVERLLRPTVPWAAGVRVVLHEPRSGRDVDGRGAIAVAPGRALRMILIGAAGATLLDAWVTPERWRIAVPPADVVRHGGRDEPGDLPVGFLRWTFFRPLEGTLTAGALRPAPLFLLRDGDARIEVRLSTCDRGKLTRISRRVRGRTERVDDCRAAAGPSPGDWARYADETSGLRMELAIESAAPAPPDERGFDDPEAGRSDAAAPAPGARARP